MPLRMSKVMKRKLKKCVNRIHNGNPSCSVSSITRNSWRSIRQCEDRSLAIAPPRQNGWRNVESGQCVASVKSMERGKLRAQGGPARSCGHLQNLREAHWQTSRNEVAMEKQNAGCRFLRFVIRHCSRCAAKTELCVTVSRSLKPHSLSLVRSSRHVQELPIDCSWI
jgi:hypothetical protein